jgi:hypothetical protein
VKLLLVLASPEYLRFFDTTVTLLAERGHQIHVVFDEAAEYKPVGLGGAGALPLASVTVVPAARTFWSDTAFAYRAVVDFLRFLHPDFAYARVLRERMRRKVLPAACQGLDRIRGLPAAVLKAWLAALRFGEGALPVDARVRQTLATLSPDLVVVSPLVDAASPQVDWIKGAQRAGIRSAVAVASWDNLTNKGLMRIRPDRVFVWNDIQRREAALYHAVPVERVVVTGAPVFDRWFDRQPSRSREAFCRLTGLPDDLPFVLFTGSSAFIADGQDELVFVRKWIQALRSSADEGVRRLRVLVRPHPYNTEAWSTADLGEPDAAVWPRGPFNPAGEEGRRDLFDSLYHAAAVVGINTSAMIEAAIVGRPVLTISEFATQQGTLHFQYLLRQNGGPVIHGASLGIHLEQLAGVLGQPPTVAPSPGAEALHPLRSDPDPIGEFVQSFVRPHGLFEASTPRLARAIEEAAALPVRRRSDAPAIVFLRPALAAFGVWVALVARLTGPDPLVPLRKQVLHPVRVVRRRAERRFGLMSERSVRSVRLAGNRLRRANHVVRAGTRRLPTVWKRWRRALRHARYTAGMWRRGES